MVGVVRGDPILDLALSASRERHWLPVAIALAMSVHLATVWAVPRLVRRRALAFDQTTEVVDIDIPKPPPSPIELPKPEEAPQPETLDPPRAAKALAPPPPPAQAAAVLTRPSGPNEPIDFTGGFVTGSAETYAGGTTAAAGTNPVAVRTTPAASGTPMATGQFPMASAKPAGPDRSKRPTLAGGAEWQCPFPSEADADQINHAVVTIRVDVDASGTAKNVTVTKDPGHGFGREARRCALDRSWSPSLDHDGVPVQGSTVVNVRFDR